MTDSENSIPTADRNDLRQFGFTFGALIAAIFGVFLPWVSGSDLSQWPIWPWIILFVFGVWAALRPDSLRPVYNAWMRFGLMMSRIVTPLIMAIVFFALITPVAVLFRLIGRDAMDRKLSPTTDTYRVESTKTTPDSLRRPY
jgi:hypothetical protein